MRFVANAAFRLNGLPAANPVVQYARGEIRAAPTGARDTAIFSTNGLTSAAQNTSAPQTALFGEIPQGIAW